MKIKNDIEVHLPLFCVGGFVAALLILSFHCTRFSDDKLPEVVPVKSSSDIVVVSEDRSPEVVPVKSASHIVVVGDNMEEIIYDEELPILLKKASMDDNTVILTSVNEVWAAPNSLLDLFRESFHSGEQIEHLLNHLLIIAMDQKAFEMCQLVHPYCYFLKTKGIDYSSEKVYRSKDYLEMMWGRNKFQQRILELGFNFLFTDVDILWFRNPMNYISPTSHLTFASDHYYGDAESLNNVANGGFVYARSCNETINFYRGWHQARKQFPEQDEQIVFNNVKIELASRYNAKIRFIDTTYCGGFCEFRTDVKNMCTMHANCCIGLENKLASLRNILDDWNKYKSLSNEQMRIKGQFQLRAPQCSI